MTLAYVSNGTVDTAEVGALADAVLGIATECALVSADVSAARLLTAPPQSASRWSGASGTEIEAAADALALAADAAFDLSTALSASADLYVTTESTVSALFETATSMTGAIGGALFSRMLLPLLGVAATIAAPAIPSLVAAAALPETRAALTRAGSVLGGAVTRWLAEHPQAARNPLAMLLVRGLVSGSDDAVKSALGMPTVLSPLVNDPRLSVPGAALGLGALGIGGVTETPVRVTAVDHARTAPPRSIAELVSRIPASGAGGSQIRVEKYTDDTGNHSWAVYVGGTVDMAVAPGDEPFDMESNAALMADADGGAYRAVVQAMDDAGVASGEPVTIAGHSQGGLVAERIAQSGQYDVRTLVTFGAPSTDAPLPDTVHAYAVEHRGDVVPALGGFVDPGGDRVVISADVPPADQGPSAHALTEYEKTAAAIDVSTDPQIVDLQRAVAGIGGDATGDVTDYRAERVSPPAEAAPVPPPPAGAGTGSAVASGVSDRPLIDPTEPDAGRKRLGLGWFDGELIRRLD